MLGRGGGLEAAGAGGPPVQGFWKVLALEPSDRGDAEAGVAWRRNRERVNGLVGPRFNGGSNLARIGGLGWRSR
jgi:hypothetical protein